MSASFFGQTSDQMDQKCPYLTENASYGPNLAVFGPKIHFWGGGSKTLGTLISGTPLSCWKCWLLRLQLAAWDKNVQSMPKKWVFGPKVIFFVWESRFLSTGHITSTPGAITFPFGPTQRKIPFRRYGSFWAILGQKPVKKKKSAKRLTFIMGTFLFAELCLVVARAWLESKLSWIKNKETRP